MTDTTSRNTALKLRHAELDAAIDQERAKMQPDELKLQTLKRQKLAIKDELALV